MNILPSISKKIVVVILFDSSVSLRMQQHDAFKRAPPVEFINFNHNESYTYSLIPQFSDTSRNEE